jgi:rhodanese-related sulfurtransferase
MITLLALVLSATAISNPQIDMDGYLRLANEAAAYRETRRVSEEEFLRLAAGPGTIILDARSPAMYRSLHVKGAINLTFSDIAIRSLEETIPDRTTRILIYCNNNFRGAEAVFASKVPQASLNLSTFIALYTYGYRNVYELGPNVELMQSKLPFEGTRR